MHATEVKKGNMPVIGLKESKKRRKMLVLVVSAECKASL